MTVRVISRKLEVMVCGSVVECLPTIHKALGSMPNTAGGTSAPEDGSIGKVLVVQSLGPKFGSQVHVKKLGEVV